MLYRKYTNIQKQGDDPELVTQLQNRPMQELQITTEGLQTDNSKLAHK